MPTSRVKKIEYVVYVDPAGYKAWPLTDKYAVARVVGKINQLLEGKTYALLGPGRWGSANPELGVPVKYAEISNTKLLVEISHKEADYLPEVSFGTHFFQDLIEDNIVYVPLFPDERGATINYNFFKKENVFRDLLKDEYYSKYEDLIKVINLPKATGGHLAEAIMNSREDRGLLYIKSKK